MTGPHTAVTDSGSVLFLNSFAEVVLNYWVINPNQQSKRW